ncbi:ABC transporter permease [candidate division KSB1 bacterium]
MNDPNKKMTKHKSRPPGILEWMLNFMVHPRDFESLPGDFEEIYSRICDENGKIPALGWYIFQIIKLFPVFVIDSLYWSVVMFKNYLITAARSFRRNKTISFINISGLAIGIACCIFIIMYVSHERSYDTFRKDTDRIYHVPMIITMGSSEPNITTTSSGPLAQVLRDDYPEVEYASRILRTFRARVRYNNEDYYEQYLLHTDKEMFDIFSIELLNGEYLSAIENPGKVLITEKIAEKIFGDSDPLGKTLTINNSDFQVTGILKNAPTNSILQYNFIVSIQNYRVKPEEMTYWPNHYGMTYVKLKEGVDPTEFEKKIEMIAHKYYGDYFKMRGWTYACFLQPLKDIHLNSEIGGGFVPSGSMLYVYALSVIGLLILVISCLNYVNLSSVRVTVRSTEIGIRKVSGANNNQLIFQFLGESFLTIITAFFASIFLLAATLPIFNELVQKQFQLNFLLQWEQAFIIILLLTITAVIAGLYPALISSKLRPVLIIAKRQLIGNSRSLLRKSLIVTQFVITVVLFLYDSSFSANRFYEKWGSRYKYRS